MVSSEIKFVRSEILQFPELVLMQYNTTEAERDAWVDCNNA